MLLTKFNKKYSAQNEKGISTTDFQTNQIINNEVLNFIRNEKLNRENLKLLEMKIEQKLQNKNSSNANSQAKLTRLSSQHNGLKLTTGGLMSDEQQKLRSMSRVNSKQGNLLPQIGNLGASQSNLQTQNNIQQQDWEESLNEAPNDQFDNKFSQTQDVTQLQKVNYLIEQSEQPSYLASFRNPLIMETSTAYKKDKDRSIKSELSNEDEWAEVDKYRQLLHDRDLQLQKDKKEQQKVQTKTVLDEQVQEKKRRQQMVRQEKVKNDNMVLNQVSEYRKHQDLVSMQNHRKLMDQKQIREMQLQEVQEQKRQQKKAKRLYEKQLVDDLKLQIQAEQDKQQQKRDKLKEIADQMKKENEVNKAMKTENKMKQREQDVMMSRKYVEMVNEQERKKVEEFQKREMRIQGFMTKMEQGAIAEENKKHAYLEEQIRKYEEKKQREDFLEEERRKKRQNDNREELKNTLKDQMVERSMKKQFVKEMNNVYVKVFKDKHERDVDREKELSEQLKRKQIEVQHTILRQIEEKKAREKGMTNDEFEFNKDLLKEIASKRKELRDTVNMTTNQNITAQQMTTLPAYEIYNL
eukprot:403333518